MVKKFIFTLFCSALVFGCGSKNETIGDKIDKKLEKAEEKAKNLKEKAEEKAREIEKKAKEKMDSHKKSAPVDISFELKDNNLLILTINLNQPVKNLIVQANPLDGLEIDPVEQVVNSIYDEPTTLMLSVSLKNNVGRLGVYIAGAFNGRQLATSQTYDFPDSKKRKLANPPTEIDSNGNVIRVFQAEEK